MRRKLLILLVTALVGTLAGLPARALQGTTKPIRTVATSNPLEGLLRTKACGGHYELRIGNKALGCTHGIDGPGLTANAAPTYPTTYDPTKPAPAVPCVGDGTTGPRVEVIYAVPILPQTGVSATAPVLSTTSALISAVSPSLSTVTQRLPNDKYDERLNAMKTIFSNMDDRIVASAAQTNGYRHIAFKTDANCEVVINRVNLTAAGDDSFNNTVTEISQLGFNRADRKYLVLVESNVLCGIGSVQIDDTPGSSNKNNGTLAQYARVDTQKSGCFEGGKVATHELFHAMGAVLPSAPHATKFGHCFDGGDLMCYDDDATGDGIVTLPNGTTKAMTSTCVDNRDRLDCNHDDYFHTAPPAGNYLATKWNTADSSFLSSTLPTPPRTMSFAAESGALTFSWVQPVTDNGVVVSGYEATLYNNGAKLSSQNVTTRSARFTGLTNGTTYQVAVRAINATGRSLPLLGTGAPGALSATIAAPAYVGEPFVATFNGAVSGVTTSNFTVTPKDSSTATTGNSVVCTDAALVSVACNGTAVRRAVLTVPSTLPGEQYVAKLNPTGVTAPITAGSTASAFPAVTTAALPVWDAHEGAPTVFTWPTATDTLASGGSYNLEATPGATATFAFTGTSVVWHSLKGPDQGIAGVSIDGGTEQLVNLYAATKGLKANTASGLSNGPHTIKIRVTGTKASAATAARVSVDGFTVNGAAVANPTVTYAWAIVSDSQAADNTTVAATSGLAGMATGAIASITYRDANYIGALMIKGPDQGKIRVSVDGESTVIDLYNATPLRFHVTIHTQTFDPTHVAMIEVLNEKNAASTGYGARLDGWRVGN